MGEDKIYNYHHSKRYYSMLYQDLNCLPFSIVMEELSENQQIDDSVLGWKLFSKNIFGDIHVHYFLHSWLGKSVMALNQKVSLMYGIFINLHSQIDESVPGYRLFCGIII
ncbi:hypothetical protein NE237_023330 [Protea cynaroides]|uniref:Uncharacterized protein n=1 Tax=Protea cynaroides TaxID=273540 RepID=A0A9Q0K520_9MAGN|nr:hypothetical protein NE237_023330 [Protea cynaroides]